MVRGFSLAKSTTVFASPSPSVILSTAKNLAQGKLREAISAGMDNPGVITFKF